MIIKFEEHFAELILSGDKKHTIRRDKQQKWEPGKLMHMHVGSKFHSDYRHIATKECVLVQEIRMIYKDPSQDYPEVWIDGRPIHYDWEKDLLAINDGFASFAGMIRKPFHTSFEGRLIIWDENTEY